VIVRYFDARSCFSTSATASARSCRSASIALMSLRTVDHRRSRSPLSTRERYGPSTPALAATWACVSPARARRRRRERPRMVDTELVIWSRLRYAWPNTQYGRGAAHTAPGLAPRADTPGTPVKLPAGWAAWLPCQSGSPGPPIKGGTDDEHHVDRTRRDGRAPA